MSINEERSVSIKQFLRSVINVNESSLSMNKNLKDYFAIKMLEKSHDDAKQISDAVLNELSNEFFCLRESFKA